MGEDVNVVGLVSPGLFEMLLDWGQFFFVVELGVGVTSGPVAVESACVEEAASRDCCGGCCLSVNSRGSGDDSSSGECFHG